MSERVGHAKTDGILRRTRQEPVYDRVDLGNGFFVGPESLQRGLYPHWGILWGEEEAFLLTERDFPSINGSLLGLPDRLIRERIERGYVPTVLDLGGGRDGTSARYIADKYPSTVLNVDIVAVNEQTGRYSSRQGDLRALPVNPSSIDVAYSHQVFPYFSEENRTKVLEETVRVLRPGGVAILDVDARGQTSNPWRKEVSMLTEDKPGLKVEWGRKSYGGDFVVISK